jgi:hypothetical protein
MRNMIIFCLLLAGCGALEEDCGCDCHMNDDGTMNFRVAVVGETMMIKSEGQSYIKEDINVSAMNAPIAERQSTWRNMKDGTRIESDLQIESLESCSLLYHWKRKSFDKFLSLDTGVVMLTDTAS